MNTLGDRSSSRYYSSSHNRSHCITNYHDGDTTDDVSVASGITLESLQAVTSEMVNTKVYLRHIMENLSLPTDGSSTVNNTVNKSSDSSDTTGKTT